MEQLGISAGASATQMAIVGSSLASCRYDTSNDCLLFTHMSLMRFLYTKFPVVLRGVLAQEPGELASNLELRSVPVDPLARGPW